MGLKKHEKVYVNRVKREGFVQEVLATGDVRIVVGSLVLVCAPDELTPMKSIKLSGKRTKPAWTPPGRKSQTRAKLKKRAPQTTSLDLHGMRVEEALRVVEKKINDAILADIDRLEIVHGIGTGRLKEAIHKYLAGLSVVENFQVDISNPGVTWVYF